MGLIDVIRHVQCEDLNLLTSLFERNNRPELTKHFSPFPLTEDSAKQIACFPGLDLYYISITDGFAVGFGMLRGWNEGFEIPSFGLLVDYQHHGRGYGRQLMSVIMKEATDLAKAVRLTVNKSNEHALKLYKSMEFGVVSSTELGNGETRLVMQKVFNNES